MKHHKHPALGKSAGSINYQLNFIIKRTQRTGINTRFSHCYH